MKPEDATTNDATHPEAYPHRVLVAATGMSPQVVTETIYALAVDRSPAFVPTEVRLVTTQQGKEEAESVLLDAHDGWFRRLRSDYKLPPIKFDAERIHVIEDASGTLVNDLRAHADNTAAADAITQLVCDLTRDESCALHVSIAGGRKTMGFYLGYALSLYGRRQDRLSHVLVSPDYESLPKFFYPTPASELIETKKGGEVDAQDGEVSLAEIPFVRMRDGLPEDLREGNIRFHDAVDAAQRAIGPVELIIDLEGGCIRAGGHVVNLPPAQLAFLAWFARRQKAGAPWLPYPAENRPEIVDYFEGVGGRTVPRPRFDKEAAVAKDALAYAKGFLHEYSKIPRSIPRTVEDMEEGMYARFFRETKSRLHHILKTALSKPGAAAYLVSHRKGERRRVYGLDIPAAAIHFGSV